MTYYISLASSAFLSATLLPGGSELLLLYGLEQHYPTLIILTIASLFNTLGAITNLFIGRYAARLKPWQPSSKGQIKAYQLIQKYGIYSLLLSWAPIIGDALCLAAGYLRLPYVASIILLFIAKTLRYSIVIATYYWLQT